MSSWLLPVVAIERYLLPNPACHAGRLLLPPQCALPPPPPLHHRQNLPCSPRYRAPSLPHFAIAQPPGCRALTPYPERPRFHVPALRNLDWSHRHSGVRFANGRQRQPLCSRPVPPASGVTTSGVAARLSAQRENVVDAYILHRRQAMRLCRHQHCQRTAY